MDDTKHTFLGNHKAVQSGLSDMSVLERSRRR